MLLPGVELHHLLPIAGHLIKAVVAAEVDEVEDIFLKTAATKSRTGLEELGADAGIGTDRLAHFHHIGAGGLAESGDGVDRGDALGEEGVGSELGELTAPEVGAQNALGGTHWP